MHEEGFSSIEPYYNIIWFGLALAAFDDVPISIVLAQVFVKSVLEFIALL